MKNGFTLLELIIVLSILGIITLFIFSAFTDYKDTQVAEATVVEINSLIKETRQKTISAETSSQFGLHFATSSLTVFEGAVYSASNVTNRIYNFSNTNIDTELSSGGNDIIFSRLTGVTNATGTIAVGHSRLNSTTTLIMQTTGLIE